MNKISHLLVTKTILSKYTDLNKKQKILIMAGSVLPDVLIHTYVKGHTWSDRSSQVFQIIRAHGERSQLHLLSFLRYGCALHYVEDFFTWTHNSTFKGTLKEHAAYEMRLYRYLASRKGELHQDGGVYVQDSEQLISKMEGLHKEYMKMKPEMEIDQYYIMTAAGMTADYLFAAQRSRLLLFSKKTDELRLNSVS